MFFKHKTKVEEKKSNPNKPMEDLTYKDEKGFSKSTIDLGEEKLFIVMTLPDNTEVNFELFDTMMKDGVNYGWFEACSEENRQSDGGYIILEMHEVDEEIEIMELDDESLHNELAYYFMDKHPELYEEIEISDEEMKRMDESLLESLDELLGKK